MINSKLSKKSVKRRSLKLKNKKTRTSKKRVVKNMKGGAGEEQIFVKNLVSSTYPNVSFETIINYELLQISFLLKNKKPKIFNFNANNTECEQFKMASNILPIFYQGIYSILQENFQEMIDVDKNLKLKTFMESLLMCMNKYNNISGPRPSAPPRPYP